MNQIILDANMLHSYTQWYFLNAISWCIFGFVIGIIPMLVKINNEYTPLKYTAYLLGTLIVFLNITTVIHPEAMAMHRLLMDITQ